MRFNEAISVETLYQPKAGCFCKPKIEYVDGRYKAGQWYYCRELFHSQLYNCDLFFFSHATYKGRSIAEFVQKVEQRLEIASPSQCGPTQRKMIMWIRPSRWWTVRAMRRSLFTILLRVGDKYSYRKDNFEDALYSDRYSVSTRYAIERFLAGNTHYTGKRRGWYQQFYEDGPTEKEIDLLLIKP